MLPCDRTAEEPYRRWPDDAEPVIHHEHWPSLSQASRVSRHCSSLDSSIVAVRDPSKSGARGIDIWVLARRGQAHVSSLARGIDGIIEMGFFGETSGCFLLSLLSRSSLRERCLLRVSCVSQLSSLTAGGVSQTRRTEKGRSIDDASATPCAAHPTAHPVLCDSLPTDRDDGPVCPGWIPNHPCYLWPSSKLIAVCSNHRSTQLSNPRGDLVPMCSASAASRLLPHMAPLNFASRGL